MRANLSKSIRVERVDFMSNRKNLDISEHLFHDVVFLQKFKPNFVENFINKNYYQPLHHC